MRGVGGVRKWEHQSLLAKGIGLGLGLLCWGFKEVQEEIPSEGASTLSNRQQLEYTLLNPDSHSWWILKMQSGRSDTLEERFDFSVGFVYTIILEELKMRKICAKFVSRVLIEDKKERRCHDSREMVELINSDPAVLNTLLTCDESWIYCYDLETEFLAKACWLSQTQEGQTEQIHPQTFDDPLFLTALAWSICTGFPLDRQSTRNTMLKF